MQSFATRELPNDTRNTPMTHEHDTDSQEGIRATFEEYDVGVDTVAHIGDPENPSAWIQSTVFVDVNE
ncbi:hypothetical protein C443_12231 [Haloarcula argentinensis DSM 12282]|nr:hypothetical protein C443_12231 [Haloarcula argentinensis DSM 12282]